MDFIIFVKPTYPLHGHKPDPLHGFLRFGMGKELWAHAWLGSPSHWPLFLRLYISHNLLSNPFFLPKPFFVI
jgi:hypothetical protein